MSDEETPTAAFGRQLERSRRRRGWSQEELADRADMSRLMVNRIETRARGRRVDLDEALRLAFALDVAPVHLIAPREDAALLRVTSDEVLDALSAREWVRGDVLPKEPIEWGPEEWGEAVDFFWTEVPPAELRTLRGPLRSLHHRAKTVLALVDDLASRRTLPKKGDFKYLDEEILALQEELDRVKRMRPPVKKKRKEA